MSARSAWRRLHAGAVVAAVVAVVVATVLAGGCGISVESDAHRVPPDHVPFDLLTELPASDANAGGRPIRIFLWQDRLVEVERAVPVDASIGDVVATLAAGPTEGERASGLSTSLPAGEVNGVRQARGVVTVDLAPSFADLRSADQVIAIAQLVYTLTAQPGVGRVGFTLDGKPVEVPRGDGSLTTDALAREDIHQVAP